MHPTASAGVQLGILGLAIVMVGLFVAAQATVARQGGGSPGTAAIRAALGAAGWMVLTGAVAASGVLSRFDLRPPPAAFLFVGTAGLGIALGRGRVGTGLAGTFPVWALVLVQGFRLPLELVMHAMAEEGTMPDSMTWTGWNFDVVTGATALVVAPILRAGGPRWLAWAWNLLGIATLVAITIVAFLSTPVVAFFGPDQLNTFIASLPFVWLPTVLVTAAIAGHWVLTRRLLEEARRGGSSPKTPLRAVW